MFKPRRVILVVTFSLCAALVLEPFPGRTGYPPGRGPNLATAMRSSLGAITDSVATALSAVGNFLGGVFGSSSVRAARPGPSPSPSQSATPAPVEVTSRRTRDSKVFKLADGRYEAQFGRYMHYKDANGVWQDVNLNFRKVGSDNVMDRHDLKVKATGSVIELTERATGKGIRFPLPAEVSVSGRKATFRGADGRDWIYTTTKAGLKLEVTISSKLGPKSYLFPYELLGGAAGLSIDEEGALASDVFRIPRPMALGADGEIYETGAWRLESGAVAFDFDDSSIPNAALPYVLDPGVTFAVVAGGDDGINAKKGITYPPGGTVQFESSSTGILAARKKVTGTLPYQIYNGLVRWNTSSLPDQSFIDQSWVTLSVDSVNDADNRAMTADWYANWPIDGGDYSQSALSTANLFGAAGWDLSNIPFSVGGTANNLMLVNLMSISRTSYTGLRFHINGGQPNGSNQVRAFSIEGTGTEPRLYVRYMEIVMDSPADGAVVPTVTPVLKANSTEPTFGAGYEFQIADDANFTTNVRTSGYLPNTNTFTVAPGWLKDGRTYHWRVRGRQDNGEFGPWSTSPRSFSIRIPKLGISDNWPMWSTEAVAVNQAIGNLVVSAPGPVYPTANSSMTAAASYNHQSAQDLGLGAGWTLGVGDALGSLPIRLVDHNQLTGANRFDAVEIVFQDGSIDFYSHLGSSNSYISTPGDGSVLKKNADNTWMLTDVDGSLYTFSDPQSGTYTLTSAERTDSSPGQGMLTYTFNSSLTPARISSLEDPAGRALTFTWNVLNPDACINAILCISGPDGVTWRFIGNAGSGASGKLARVNNGTRDLVAITYDASGRPEKIQNANDLDPSGASPGYNPAHAVTIAYDTASPARVQSITDGPVTGQTPTNSIWSFEYFPGLVTTSASAAHGGGRQAEGYTLMTPPNQQEQPSPKKTKVYYDNLGRTIEAVDLLGNKTLTAYNDRDQLIWTEDEEGNPTDNTYDALENVLLSSVGPDPDGTGPLGRPTITYRYDETSIGTAAASGPTLAGLQAAYYDNINLAGQPKKRQNDSTVSFNWANGGPPALPGVVDSFSVRWTGNVNITNNGTYTFATIADDGTRLTVGGISAIDDWNVHAATTKTSPPIPLTAGLHKISLEYFDSTGTASVQLRWACGDCSPSISDQVIPSTALRPGWLNQTSTVEPGGNVRFRHFADPASVRPDYDLVQVEGQNLITAYEYEAQPSMGRMLRKTLPKGNASRTIDSAGNLLGSPNPQYSTTWTYYGLTETASLATCGGGSTVGQAGLTKSIEHYGMSAVTTAYNSAGRPVKITTGGGASCTGYDTEGRTVSTQAPGEAQPTTYTFDPVGAQRSAVDANGVVTSEYDEAGRLKRSIDSYGAESIFIYDAEGNPTRRTSAKGALATNPNYNTDGVYNAAGQLIDLTDPAGRTYGFSYDSRGNLRAVQYPNGTFSWREYNAAGWLTALYNRHGTLPIPLPAVVPSDPSPIVDYSYVYDVKGKKTQETRTGGGLATEVSSFTYDALGRLADVGLPSGVFREYDFDLDSNRTAIYETPVSGSRTLIASYSYSPSTGLDQLLSVTAGSTTTFGYTSDGQVSSRGSDTLTWDGRGRHTGGTFGGVSVSYGFDPMGRRRNRTSGATITKFLFAGSDAPVFETDSAGMIHRSNVSGPVGDLAHYLGPPQNEVTITYLYFNGHGDLAAEANNAGSRTAAYTYDPYGGTLQPPALNSTIERWTAQWDKQLDTQTSLVQMGVRPYDPVLGRFLAVDTIEGGNLNPYDYAGQDPINSYDLSGRYRYEYKYDAGPGGGADAISLMFMIRARPNMFFPFPVCCGAINPGRHLSLGWAGILGPVRVERVTLNGFVFKTMPGHVEGAGAIIGFELKSIGGRLRFRVKAWGPNGRLGFVINPFRHALARCYWSRFADNIHIWNRLYFR